VTLYECDVIEAVCRFLESRGYRISHKLGPRERGDDIIALREGSPDRPLLVEAKGATSSNPASKRYGKPFDAAQIRVHIAEALYKAATVVSRSSPTIRLRTAIALPATDRHRELIKRIEPVLNRLEIGVFWVADDRGVQFASPWDL
jgi:hypothetical protein